ncbi:ATPase, T2SS/T4P/T4SS family [Butyrivibrio sp. WCE2006]|uniref:ATPase, T2SS/T4P/T4SS family n=1 Tax=Butyrivibrio sp. WCE2006 TaxID=1410611 RepID=UPI00067883F3|nr:ATPase, T2SS/T4P/T4SS family [Butyrivibrio sp. WCE2006]
MEHDKLKSEIRERILAGMDFSRDISDDEMLERIDKGIIDYSREQSISLNEKLRLRKELFYSIRKLDVLQLLVDDSEITEIMVNGMNNIFVEKNGSLYKHELKFESAQKLEDVIQQIVSKCNRVVNEASPIVDARLEKERKIYIQNKFKEFM